LLGTVNLNSGLALLTVNSLSVGNHTITSFYPGDAAYISGGGRTGTQTITKAIPAISIGSSPNPSTFGQSVTITATLPAAATGKVQFLMEAQVGDGERPERVAALSHSFTATYSDDANHQAAISSPAQQTVNKIATTTTLTSSANPGVRNRVIVFTATVSPSSATGVVQFSEGSTVLGTVNLDGGSASFSISKLGLGTHPITTTYSGDTNFNASTSPVLSEVISACLMKRILSRVPAD
jgi:hypothetical protein